MPANTLVFFPGYAFSSSIFSHVRDDFSADVILIDWQKKLSVDEINQHLPDNAILIGWSIGSMMAAILCEKFPHKYRKLITICSNPAWIANDNWPGMQSADFIHFMQLAADDPKKLLQQFLKLVNGRDRHTTELREHLLMIEPANLLFYLQWMQQDQRVLYQQLQLPVLHLLGDRDYLVPASCANLLAQHYPAHKVQSIPDAGHIPFLTHRNEFVTHVRNFIDAE